MKKIIFLLLTMLTFHNTQAQEIKTMTYFQNDTIKLDLDLYLPKKKTNEKIPLIIFAFGEDFPEENVPARKNLECLWQKTAMQLQAFLTAYI